MRLFVFFIYFASWELSIIGPDENCSFPAFFNCVNKVAFNFVLFYFFCCYIVEGKHVNLQVFTLWFLLTNSSLVCYYRHLRLRELCKGLSEFLKMRFIYCFHWFRRVTILWPRLILLLKVK